MMVVYYAVAGGILATILTSVIRRYALLKGVMDVPNERSLHSTATPRGGGVAFVLSSLASFLLFEFSESPAGHVVWLFVLGGALVSAVGFLDDHNHVGAGWRLVAHFSAAALVIAGIMRTNWPVAYAPVLVFAIAGSLLIVWLINLTNFMDGIDGLAGAEAVTVCVCGALLFWQRAPLPFQFTVITAGATLGFLVWNWPPAKIFMGDAGSGYLGYLFGVIALTAASYSTRFLWAWIVLLAAFIGDATFTLMRRLVRGVRIYQAHRTHAYQIAALRLHSHRSVTLAVVVFNLFWLFPIAYGVSNGLVNPAAAIVFAYTPPIIAGIRLGAGADPNAAGVTS